jgi:hypothetical protein
LANLGSECTQGLGLKAREQPGLAGFAPNCRAATLLLLKKWGDSGPTWTQFPGTSTENGPVCPPVSRARDCATMSRSRLFVGPLVPLVLSLGCGETFSAPQVPGSGGNASPDGSGGRSENGGMGGAGEPGGGAQTGGATSGGRSATGGRSASGGQDGAGGSEPATGCLPVELKESVEVASSSTDQIRWFDAQCKPRSAALARVGGGYIRQASYEFAGKSRVMTGTGSAGHPGFGYAVNHYGNTATVASDAAGTFAPVFVGKHHILYRYQFSPNIAGKNVPVTQEWLFASGRSNPVLATTFDMTTLEPGSLVADTRTPYGDIAWDGDDNAAGTTVSGVAWGDRYKFTTTSEPLTMNSSWDYSEPNQVPYVLEWATKNDAEMGTVQTQTQVQHDAGGYWFYSNWGKTSQNQTRIDGQAGVMTATWNWTYQLNQYELCLDDPGCLEATTGSHRLAWGSNYGALGGNDESGTYAVYGDDKFVSGYPYQSYSVFVVLGPHGQAPTYAQVLEIEGIQQTALAAKRGSLVAELPGGVGRTDNVPLDPPGYDSRYATWNVQVDTGGEAEFSVEGPGLSSPVIVFHGRKSLPAKLVLNNQELAPETGYFASLDPEGGLLWITLNRVFPSGGTLTLE